MRRPVLCSIASLLLSANAFAQSSPNGAAATGQLAPPDDVARAEALITEGVSLRTQQRDADALQRFEQAQAIHGTPRGLAQIALAEQALNRWVAAERHLREALAASSDGWITRNGAALRSALSVIESHLGRLEVRTNVAGAELWVAAVREGTLPLAAPIRVVIGQQPIELRAPGYQTATRTVTIAAGQLTTETVTLTPEPSNAGGGAGGAGVDLNEQTRARMMLIAGLGVGIPCQIPILGIGVRFGFFQNRFEIQGRAEASLAWDPLTATSVTVVDAMGISSSQLRSVHYLGPMAGVDGTFRLRPLSNRSPWYVGLGLMARIGGLFAAAAPPQTMTSMQAFPPRIAWALGLVIEPTGFIFGDRGQWDLSLRFAFGFGALGGAVTLGYAL
ncbi:MAG: PEGA domain-containing protein [Polyangiales bacterium]